MPRWEYCIISNPASGTDGLAFSRPQHDTIVQEYSAALGRGLKAERSNTRFLHPNLNHVSPVQVAGVLGAQGWELVTHAALTGGHEYWTFRKGLDG